MTHDLRDLRLGDLMIREAHVDGRTERHLGEVVYIRARVRYLNLDWNWNEWWDISTGCLHPFLPRDEAPYRLRRAPHIRRSD